MRILAGEIYEPQTIKFLATNCSDGDLVHAGTYFGDFLPALSRACAPGALVWAFEPNFENFRCAEITCLINGLKNVRLMHAALGEKAETRIIATTDARGAALGGASRLLGDHTMGRPGKTEKVNVAPVDQLVPQERRVSIVQLDVEGQEQRALFGCLQTIIRWRPVIVVETSPDVTWFEEHLAPLGYGAGPRIHGNHVFWTR
jgi:FkbM family methyltransferase